MLKSGKTGCVQRRSHRPEPLNEVVRRNMKAMPTRHSRPEVLLRRLLHRLGLRYSLHGQGLPGRPDVVFRQAKVAVFIDGCFWHYCARHCVLPKNNRLWWEAKLLANRIRDRRNDRALSADGWLALHVWEHEDMDAAASRVHKHVRRRSALVSRAHGPM
jgi:DNA mismatch endonuclease (patch repair protein)